MSHGFFPSLRMHGAIIQKVSFFLCIALRKCRHSETQVGRRWWSLRPVTGVRLPRAQVQQDVVELVHPQIPLLLGVGTQPVPANRQQGEVWRRPQGEAPQQLQLTW